MGRNPSKKPICVCGVPVDRRIKTGLDGAEEYRGHWYHYGCLYQKLRDERADRVQDDYYQEVRE